MPLMASPALRLLASAFLLGLLMTATHSENDRNRDLVNQNVPGPNPGRVREMHGLPPEDSVKLLDHPSVTTDQLLAQARSQAAERYSYCERAKARIIPTSDSRSFFVLWLPPGIETPARIIATISGHGSWAFDEVALWHDAAARQGCGILALQWWLGTGERRQDYYSPEEMYPLFAEELHSLGLSSRHVLFHGYSRGAANSYAMTYLDRRSGNSFFALSVANAGGYQDDFPIHRGAMADAAASDSILAGSRWILFAGGQDPHPERDGIPAMQRTSDWIQGQGGRIELFIRDARANHGGFHRTPAHLDATLAIFNRLSRAAEAAPSGS